MESSKPLEILVGDPDLAATRALRVELRRPRALVRLVARASEVRDQILAACPEVLVLDDHLLREGGEDFLDVVDFIAGDLDEEERRLLEKRF